MGGWKRTLPLVYVVSWDDAGIVKIGYSTRQRWRRFTLRGARLLALFPDDEGRGMGESAFHAAALQVAPPAFRLGPEATPYLGDPGGYLECYRLPAGMTADDFLVRCLSMMPEQCPSISPGSLHEYMPRTEKTYARTNEDVVTLR